MSAKIASQRQDVLEAFSVEPKIDKETLERYLVKYPQYSEDLIDLSFELTKATIEVDELLTEEDELDIENAWQRHQQRIAARVVNPFANLSIDQLRKIATTLGVPRSIISAFRERKVIIDTVPRAFLNRFASALNKTLDGFTLFLRCSSGPSAVRSYKSDVKPKEQEQVTFEQLLIQAGVSQETREKLLSEE